MIMKKKIGFALLILLVVIIVGLVVVSMNLGRTIKIAVETALPRMTGTDINIDKVVVRPLAGKVQIKGLILGNPEGYKSKHAIAFGEFRVDMDIKSLMSDTIHIREIVLKQPEIIYEMGLGNSNIGTILANLNKAAGPGDEEAEEEKPEQDKPEKGLVIDHLLVESPMVVISSKLTQGFGAPIPLPTIDLKDIGKDNPDGASPVQVCAQIISAIATSISVAVQESTLAVGKEVKNALGDVTETGGAALEDIVGTAGEGAKAAAGTARDAAGKAKDAVGGVVKGIFGGDEEEEQNDEQK
jgi:uncharacterized protein involved in outer membrane biogenesis